MKQGPHKPIPRPDREMEDRQWKPSEVKVTKLSPEEMAIFFENASRKNVQPKPSPIFKLTQSTASTGAKPKEEEQVAEPTKLQAEQLTKETYLQHRLAGMKRQRIAELYSLNTGSLYYRLEKWGLKDVKVEDGLLSEMRGNSPKNIPSETELGTKIGTNEPQNKDNEPQNKDNESEMSANGTQESQSVDVLKENVDLRKDIAELKEQDKEIAELRRAELDNLHNAKIDVAELSANDSVNHPPHYTQGGIECIDAIEAAVTGLHGFEAVCTANALKYLWRWKHKNGVDDLRKAQWYLSKLVASVEG